MNEAGALRLQVRLPASEARKVSYLRYTICFYHHFYFFHILSKNLPL